MSVKRSVADIISHDWLCAGQIRLRDGEVRPSGHFRRGAPGKARYSKTVDSIIPKRGQKLTVIIVTATGEACIDIAEDEYILDACRLASTTHGFFGYCAYRYCSLNHSCLCL